MHIEGIMRRFHAMLKSVKCFKSGKFRDIIAIVVRYGACPGRPRGTYVDGAVPYEVADADVSLKVMPDVCDGYPRGQADMFKKADPRANGPFADENLHAATKCAPKTFLCGRLPLHV